MFLVICVYIRVHVYLSVCVCVYVCVHARTLICSFIHLYCNRVAVFVLCCFIYLPMHAVNIIIMTSGVHGMCTAGCLACSWWCGLSVDHNHITKTPHDEHNACVYVCACARGVNGGVIIERTSRCYINNTALISSAGVVSLIYWAY